VPIVGTFGGDRHSASGQEALPIAGKAFSFLSLVGEVARAINLYDTALDPS